MANSKWNTKITQKVLNDVNNDPELLKKVTTGDETWVHDYNIDKNTQIPNGTGQKSKNEGKGRTCGKPINL